MGPDSDRWITVTPSRYEHEQEGLDHVRDHLADSSPYVAWSNFEFIASDGTPLEVDLLVLGPAGFHLVELKGWAGRIAGDERDWVEGGHRGQRPRHRPNPFLLTNFKAKVFRSWLEDVARRKRMQVDVPFVQASVFLHGPEVDGGGLPQHVRKLVFGREDAPGRHLQRIVTDRLEALPERGGPLSRSQERGLRELVDAAGLRRTPQTVRVNEWVLSGEPLGRGWGWLDNLATHSTFGDEKALVRRWFQPPGASASDVEVVRAAAEREYRLTRGLQHPGVIVPQTYAQVDGAVAALVYEHDPAARTLDTWVADEGTTADLATRLQVVRQMVEALRYAHGHGLVHRGLDPYAVVVEGAGHPVARVRDWQAAGRVEPSSTATTSHAGVLAGHQDDREQVYSAPEVLRGLVADRRSADVFSLGALAYLVLAGQPPAADGESLRARLSRDSGLLLSAVLDSPNPDLEVCVQMATHPDPAERTPTTEDLLEHLDAALDELTRPDEVSVGVDPLEAAPGDVLDNGWTVLRELGRGATAVGLLVGGPDDARAVLKAAKDHGQARRLVAEAQVLRDLPSSPFVVDLLDGPAEVGGRTCLLLQHAGEPLSSLIGRAEGLTLDEQRRFGLDLLEAAAFLERAGVVHRDVKPANLGAAKRSSDGQRHLVLFDFSLAPASATDLDAGTPGYRDPFLGLPGRRVHDPAAELFSVAVTLYEMTTGALPTWGHRQPDPATVSGEVVVDRASFDPAVAEPLSALFARALARDAATRFANPQDLARAWASAFDRPVAAVEPDPALAEQASRDTPLSQSGLSAPARSLLERHGAVTVGDVLGMDAFSLPRLAGATVASRTEVVDRAREWRARLGSQVPAGSAPSVDALIERLLPTRTSDADRVVRYLLGQPDERTSSPPVAWPTDAHVRDALDIERDVVATAWESFLRGRSVQDVLPEVRDLVGRALEPLGGTATAAELGRRVLDLRGSHLDEPVRGAQAQALVRLLVDTDAEHTMRRSGEVVLVAGLAEVVGPASLEAAVGLGRTAQDLAGRERLAPATETVQRLRDVVRSTPLGQLTDVRLLALAASASGVAAVSSRGELYLRGLAPARALRLCSGALVPGPSGLRPFTIQHRVRTRFPEAQPVPGRPTLDRLLQEAEIELAFDGDVFRDPSTTGTHSALSSSWHGSVAEVERVEPVLRRSLEQHAFLALAVSQRHAEQARGRLLRRYGVEEVDVTQRVLTRLRALAREAGDVDWAWVLSADALHDLHPDRRQLDAIIRARVQELVADVTVEAGPLLLTGAGLLARHHCVDLLRPLADLTAERRHAIWLLVPQVSAAGRDLDGVALPLGAQTQWLALPPLWAGDELDSPAAQTA